MRVRMCQATAKGRDCGEWGGEWGAEGCEKEDRRVREAGVRGSQEGARRGAGREGWGVESNDMIRQAMASEEAAPASALANAGLDVVVMR